MDELEHLQRDNARLRAALVLYPELIRCAAAAAYASDPNDPEAQAARGRQLDIEEQMGQALRGDG